MATFDSYEIPWAVSSGSKIERRYEINKAEPLSDAEANIIRRRGTLVASSAGEEQYCVRYPQERYDILFVIHAESREPACNVCGEILRLCVCMGNHAHR